MRKLAPLAISFALLCTSVQAQDTSVQEPTREQLEEMKRSLEAQRQKIEKLKEDAAKAEEELRRMQLQIDEKLNAKPTPPTKPSVPPPAGPPAPPPSISKSLAATLDPNGVLPRWGVLKVSDTVNFRFGGLVQPQYEFLQDPNSGGYSQNLFLRRARFSILGNLGPNVAIFLQTEASRIGYGGATGTKSVTPTIQMLDAFAQWAFLGKAARLQAGLFLVPTVRQLTTNYATFLTLDVPTWALQEGGVLQESLARDYGFGFNGALLENDRLSYKVGVFSGYRSPTSPQPPPLGPAAGSKDPPRIAGRIMYDFFDPEFNYAYIGTYLGERHVLGIGLVGDGQGAYKAYGGDIFFDWPLGPGGVTAEMDYLHYDGHGFAYNVGGTPTTLPEQWTLFAVAGYYFSCLKLQPYFRWETLDYADVANLAKEQTRIGGGVNYYILGYNLKATASYERIQPKVKPQTATILELNRFVLQLGGFF